MADEDHRKARVVGARPLGEQLQVLDDRVQVVDQPRLAAGAAMAVVVGRVDGGAVLDQAGGDVPVSLRVLGDPVRDQGDIASLRIRPVVDDDRRTGPGEVEVVVLHGSPD